MSDLKWQMDLVCPVTKQPLHRESDHLETPDGRFKYPVIQGIPILAESQKFTMFDDSLYKPHIGTKDHNPYPALDHHVRFVGSDWKRMLDLGSGDGVWSAPCASLVDEIYCVNPGLLALQLLQKRHIPNMFPIVAFGESLPFPDNFFDGIFNIFVIEHLEDPIPMLREMHRVLKPSGALVITTDNRMYDKYLRYVVEWREKGWGNWVKANPTHVNVMYPGMLRKYLTRASFEVVLEDYGLTGTSRRERLFGSWIARTYLTAVFRFVCRPDKAGATVSE